MTFVITFLQAVGEKKLADSPPSIGITKDLYYSFAAILNILTMLFRNYSKSYPADM